MPVNLKELAARLSLSQTTVSRALSGYSDVSPVTRERVRQMAAELGYRPNHAARQVALGRSDAIGIIYSPANEFLGNPFFRETLEGLAHGLERQGCDLMLAASPEHDELRIYERMVRGRRVDALVVANTLRDDPRIRYLQSTQLPFVAYGRTADPTGFPWLDFDNEAGAALAVQRLVALGHRRIACVRAPQAYNFAHQRHAGFLAAMAAAGLPVPPTMVADGGLSHRAGYEAGRLLLAAAPRPTAIVADTHLSGFGVIHALLDARVAIGREMSVVVTEGMPADSLITADLRVASVLQPTPYRSGQALAEMVHALVGRLPLAERQVLRQPEFLEGNSIAPPLASA